MKSWKTTLAGVSAILSTLGAAGTLYFDGDPATNPDWSAVFAGIVIGIGLIAARDNNVSSEAAGIK